MGLTLVMIIIVTVSFINCDGRACTCQQITKEACEAAGIVSYDGIAQCTWEPTHSKCRNTNWLECKKDPYCIWIKKTVDDDDESSACDEIEDDDGENDKEEQTKQDGDYINFEYSSDNPDKEEREMMVLSGSMLSSIQTQSQRIRLIAICIVVMFVFGGGIYHLCKRKKDAIIFGVNQSQYSTF